jgi:hypothetical protein
MTSQADACRYCTGSKVSSLSWIYIYSSYFEGKVNRLLKLDVYAKILTQGDQIGQFFANWVTFGGSL